MLYLLPLGGNLVAYLPGARDGLLGRVRAQHEVTGATTGHPGQSPDPVVGRAIEQYRDSATDGHGRLDGPTGQGLEHGRLQVAPRRGDQLLITKLDRLGHSSSTSSTCLLNCTSAASTWVVLDQRIDTSTPMGRMF